MDGEESGNGRKRGWKKMKFAGISSFLMLMAVIQPVHAESLADAMAQAYMSNPTIRAARAGQRATDEQVPQALSGWRPTVTVEGKVGHAETEVTPSGSSVEKNSATDPGSLSITLNQPLFRGFKTVNGTKAAEATVAAGQQGLLATEQTILLQAVQAYMNVVRDRSIVSLRQKNVSVLDEQLRASDERFKVGEVTRTDVAQARARVSQAQALLAAARASLAASSAGYIKIVGSPPGTLRYPKIAKLPTSLDTALATASETNPNVLAAALVAEASTHQIEVVKGDLLPTVSLQAQASVTDDLGVNGGTTESASVLGVISVPLYEGGRVYSSVRQAKQTASQKRIQVIEANRAVRESVTVAWNNLLASRQTIIAANSQVSASSLALDGVRQENAAGSRTTLDVLNAESEVFDARISLVNAEHDAVVAAYQLLSSMGQLTARHLELAVDYYDVDQNYGAVRNKWIGTGAETVE